MKKLLLFSYVLLIICLLSCKPKNETSHLSIIPHWSYQGETSPEHWTEIEQNSDCNGLKQSPVNIVEINAKKIPTKSNPLAILYTPKTILHEVENNGHSIQFNFQIGDSIQYHKETFHLSQLHFHEPAEHTLDGIRYPLEIHLVHKSKSNSFTVLSVLAKEGRESQLFEFLESFLPIKENVIKSIDKSLDLSTLFPIEKSFYSYNGSLTTPPCTENVNWVVFKQPIIISLEEVLKLKKNMPLDNYRNEQPLNNRFVYLNQHN